MPIQQPSLRLMNTLLNAETRRIAVFTTGNGYRRLVAGRGHNGTHEPSMRSLYRFSNAANFWSRSILRRQARFPVNQACEGDRRHYSGSVLLATAWPSRKSASSHCW